MQPVSNLGKPNLALEKSGEEYYEEGQQLDRNQEFEKATDAYEKAVNLGHVPAAMILAKSYLFDEEGKEKKVIEYATHGLEKTGGEAEYLIGRAYFRTGKERLKEAQGFFEASFNQDYEKSEYFLALIYLESPMRYEEGFSILLKLAEDNHLTAQSEIAKIYQKKGSEKDLIEARRWFERACRNPKCLPSNKYYLAKMYLKGEGGEQRTDQGLELLKSNKDADSYALLSFAYLKGDYGVERNTKIFCEYLEKAYNLGNQWAIQTYAHFCEKGLEGVIDKNLAKALEIYKWQAALGKQWAKEGLEKINSQSED
jgi:TPR repeat protein